MKQWIFLSTNTTLTAMMEYLLQYQSCNTMEVLHMVIISITRKSWYKFCNILFSQQSEDFLQPQAVTELGCDTNHLGNRDDRAAGPCRYERGSSVCPVGASSARSPVSES